MENTNENKAKFFALYWGQNVQRYNNDHYIKVVNGFIDGSLLDDDYLLLTPLSQITDEDAREVIKMIFPTLSEVTDITRNGLRDWQFVKFGHDNNHIILAESGAIRFANYSKPLKNFIGYRLDVYDYLRSKSYALPWMGLSVDQLVSFGWVKLKEATNEH